MSAPRLRRSLAGTILTAGLMAWALTAVAQTSIENLQSPQSPAMTSRPPLLWSEARQVPPVSPDLSRVDEVV